MSRSFWIGFDVGTVAAPGFYGVGYFCAWLAHRLFGRGKP